MANFRSEGSESRRLPVLVPLRELLEQLSAEVGRIETWGQAVWDENPHLAGTLSGEKSHGRNVVFASAEPHSIERQTSSHSIQPPSILSQSIQDSECGYTLRQGDDSGSGFQCFASEEGASATNPHKTADKKHRGSTSDELSDNFENWCLQYEPRQEWQNPAELAMWFEGITTPNCRALSPEAIQSLFIAADGGCSFDIEFISELVINLRQHTEELASVHQCKRASTKPVHAVRMSSAIHPSLSRCSGTWIARYGLCEQHPVNYLTFNDFLYLMDWTDLQKVLTYDLLNHAIQVREVLIRQCVERLILKFSGLKPAQRGCSRPLWVSSLEPLVGIVVCVNAITLGMSSDVKWSSWRRLEIAFTIFYCFELILKIFIYGFHELFTGQDRSWNIFDVFIVGLALIDIAVTQFASVDSELNSFTMIRIARLARITRLMRLIRLLRLHFFKELLLMVKGVVAGIRTIGWACVLLALMIYMISVGLRQTVGEDRLVAGADQTVLFHSIGWSMFTVFRCFTADCTLTDGTSVLGFLYKQYGYKFVLPYCIVTLFVLFGIFNLIMAVFVENVTESARQKRQLTREDERARVVRKLRQLVMKLGSYTVEHEPLPRQSSMVQRASSSFTQMLRLSDNEKVQNGVVRPSSLCFQYGGKITREMFNEVIFRKDVNDILDDLEVHISDRTELFDVIDADRNGTVDVSELINGLLKLRSGGADKSDIVAVTLAIRSLQKQVSMLLHESRDTQELAVETLHHVEHQDDTSCHPAVREEQIRHTPSSHRESNNGVILL